MITACGGVTTGQKGSSADGGATAVSPDGLSPLCPTEAPLTGAACSPDGLMCEYGPLNFNIACDNVMQCQSGTWSSFPSGLVCTPDGPNAASCLTFAELDKEPTCDENAPAASQLCTYPEGVCECDWGGSPNGFIWSCDTPEPGCPLPRPRVGSACTGDVDCDYVNCGYDQACMNGLWVGNADGCD
jgi:hypothetical protein